MAISCVPGTVLRASCVFYLIHSFSRLYTVGAIVIPISQVRKLSFRKGKQCVQSHSGLWSLLMPIIPCPALPPGTWEEYGS